MTILTVDKVGEFRRLREAYDATFQQWVQEVHLWEALQSAPDGSRAALDEAGKRAERAQNAFREIRNRLAALVLSAKATTESSPLQAASSKDLDSTADPRQASQVRRLAHWLWEQAGKPEGNADMNWYRAEMILNKSKPGGQRVPMRPRHEMHAC